MSPTRSPIFLHPIAPLLLNLFVYILSYFVYDIKDITPDYVWYSYVLITITAVIISISWLNWKSLTLDLSRLPLIKPILILILCISVFEYLVMGVPLFGQIVYAEFGLPLFHHIAVSSWLIIFGLSSFNNKILRLIFLLFFFANPILMLNRDLMLITFFMLLIYLWSRKRIGYNKLFFGLAFVVIIFGLLGQLRSPHALKAITLPFSFDINEYPPIFTWLLLYVTSSSFNFYNNVSTLSMELYSVFINVFPEPYGWSAKFGSFILFYFYFLFSLLTLFFFRTIATFSKLSYWMVFYLYLIYQSYMSIFSTKFFTTNTIFVFLIFFIASFFSFVRRIPDD